MSALGGRRPPTTVGDTAEIRTRLFFVQRQAERLSTLGPSIGAIGARHPVVLEAPIKPLYEEAVAVTNAARRLVVGMVVDDGGNVIELPEDIDEVAADIAARARLLRSLALSVRAVIPPTAEDAIPIRRELLRGGAIVSRMAAATQRSVLVRAALLRRVDEETPPQPDPVVSTLRDHLLARVEPERLCVAATDAQLDATEELLGAPLWPLLRMLYLHVANGGFGPGGGVLPAVGGRPRLPPGLAAEDDELGTQWLAESAWLDVADEIAARGDDDPPPSLVRLGASAGGHITYLDHTDGSIVTWRDGAAVTLAANLPVWLRG